jgi:hypothetical protein
MKNCKGELLVEETLKIVIAVICIGFLVVFLLSLYFTNLKSQDLEFAEASLNYLIEGINSGQVELEIYNPNGWLISSWPHEVNVGGVFGIGSTKEERIPKSCSNVGWEKCICICKKDNPDDCDKNGFCLEGFMDIEENEKSTIKIENPPLVLIINYEDNKITKNGL